MRFRKFNQEELDALTGLEAVKAKVYLGDLAEEIGLSAKALQKWDRIPAERVKEISVLVGIPAHILRPDVYEGYSRD